MVILFWRSSTTISAKLSIRHCA